VRIELPTIFTRLKAKRSVGLLLRQLRLLLIYQVYQDISKKHAQFFKACKTGKLPAVSYIDPNGRHDEGPASGNQGNDDHLTPTFAPASTHVADLQRVTSSPAWPARCSSSRSTSGAGSSTTSRRRRRTT